MNNDYATSPDLHFDQAAKTHLAESAKWGRFLSIVGFVLIGLMVLGALALMVMGPVISSTLSEEFSVAAGIGLGLLYMVIAAIYLYPTLRLFNFAKNAKMALASNDTHLLSESMRHLSGMFKFFGLLTAIVLGLYALIFVFALLAALLG